MSATETRIKTGHPVRKNFFGRSTGKDQGCYYSTKGHAINAFDAELQTFDLCLDRDDIYDFHGDDGRKVIDVHDEFKHCVGRAVISWHRMSGGKWEFIGYLT